MKHKTTKSRLISSLIASACILSSSHVMAANLDLQILKTTSYEDVKQISKDLVIEAYEHEGITQIGDDTEIEADFTPAASYNTTSFKQGDFIMLCFKPPVSLHIRIVDTAPNGKETVLFPSDGNVAHKVTGGKRYCVGDENSNTLLMMDEASGIGKGKVWIIGTSNEKQAQTLSQNQFSLPQTGEDYEKAAGSVSSKIGIVTKFEGWVSYEVE